MAFGQEKNWLIKQGLTSPPTQYRLYGRRFLQVKRPNQQEKRWAYPTITVSSQQKADQPAELTIESVYTSKH